MWEPTEDECTSEGGDDLDGELKSDNISETMKHLIRERERKAVRSSYLMRAEEAGVWYYSDDEDGLSS